MVVYRFEFEGGMIGGGDFASKLATFAGQLANQLPIGWVFLEAYMQDKNLLVVRLQSPEAQDISIGAGSYGGVKSSGAFLVLVAIVAAIIGIALVIGWVAVRYKVEEEQTRRVEILVESCEQQLAEGRIDQAGYLKCINVAADLGKPQQSTLDRAILIGGVILIVGGGFLLYREFIRK